MAEYKEFFYPFNASVDDEGNLILDASGEPDRLYDMDDFARERNMFFSNGIFPNPSNNLKVEAVNGNMTVTVRQGTGFINGHVYALHGADMEMQLEPSNSVNPRNDVVLLVLDMVQRKIYIKLVKGTPNPSPSDPYLIRNADIWELKLASIRVNAGAMQITQSNIIDTRLNNEVCGIVSNLVTSVDTEDLFNQYKTYLDEQIILWDSIRDAQQNNWEKQLVQQQSDYETFKSLIDAWRDLTIAELAQQVTFDFDNTFALPGTTRNMLQDSNSIILQIKITSSGQLIAEKIMINNMPENITTDLRLYDIQTQALKYHRRSIMTLVGGLPKMEVLEL